MAKLMVIMGPTASGKSALGLRLAQQLDGEIVSVDSMQLYRGLEIGTAQPTETERALVPHHLVGICDISERVDIYSYLELAERAIADIQNRGKIPVLVGGTGLYLRALLYGLDDLPSDRKLRRQLDEQYDNEAGELLLQSRMRELDPSGLAKYGNCRRRLIRALEVRLLTGESITTLQGRKERKLRPGVCAWKLDLPPDQLREKIARRTKKMLEAGWIAEARQALSRGLLNTPTAHQALGYKLIDAHLKGELNETELSERLVIATSQYARRQRTWFRHQHPEAQIIRDPEQFKIC